MMTVFRSQFVNVSTLGDPIDADLICSADCAKPAASASTSGGPRQWPRIGDYGLTRLGRLRQRRREGLPPDYDYDEALRWFAETGFWKPDSLTTRPWLHVL
jgi:hypothetical protein